MVLYDGRGEPDGPTRFLFFPVTCYAPFLLSTISLEALAYLSSFLVVLTAVSSVALTYIWQSKWREISTIPFLSDATYDDRQHLIFIMSSIVSALATLVTGIGARRAQPAESAIGNLGLLAATLAFVAISAASIVSANIPWHWPLATGGFGA